MKRTLTVALLALLSIALVPTCVQAGAWLQKKDGGYVKISYASFRSSTAYDQNGDTVDLNAGGLSAGDYKDISFNTYLEYGLHDKLTLIANVPIKQASKGGERSIGPGDLTAGFRTPVLSGPVVLSVSSSVKVPLYTASQFAAPSLGTAKVDGDFRVLVGRSFWPIPGYGTAEVGYRRRGGFADQVVYSAEMGGTFAKRIDAQIRVAGENSRIDPSLVVLDPANPNLGDQDFLNLGGGLAVKAGEVSITFDAIHTVSGRNTAKGTYLGIGVSHSW